MDKRYLLMKCGNALKPMPIDCFTASNMTEAKQALKWLREHHPERQELQLGPGEFFELIAEDHCSGDEWEQGLARLKDLRKKKIS